MGYSHYWYTKRTLPNWSAFQADAVKLVEGARSLGLKIAGPHGTGEPEITADDLALNGACDCGHTKDESIIIPWPTRTASGIGSEPSEGIAGSQWAGTSLETRVCNGDCSYESFVIDRTWPEDREHWIGSKDKRYQFECCKTAYRPYDVLVTALLIAAKHHFGTAIRVSSDGESKDWDEARMLCEVTLGYGRTFDFTPQRGDEGGHLENLAGVSR